MIAKTEGKDWRKFRILRDIQEELNTPPAEMQAFVNKDLHRNAFTKNELLDLFAATNEEINEECMSKNTLNGKDLKGLQLLLIIKGKLHYKPNLGMFYVLKIINAYFWKEISQKFC